jgi:hypothetical protein
MLKTRSSARSWQCWRPEGHRRCTGYKLQGLQQCRLHMPCLSPTVVLVLVTAEDTAGGSAGSFSRFRYLCVQPNRIGHSMRGVHAGQTPACRD